MYAFFVEAAALRSIVLRYVYICIITSMYYAGAPIIATRVSFCLFREDDAFSEYVFCTISAFSLSLYGL